MAEGPEISNPFSTGGGGVDFENQVQSVFVVLMLTGGVAPSLPHWRIVKIKLQGRCEGFRTDDCIVFVEDKNQSRSARLLAQIKHTVSITANDVVFGEAIKAAWLDFQNRELFDPKTDVIALITGPLSAHDIENARPLLELAQTSATAPEFFEKISLAKFSSEAKQQKLQAFRSQLQKANGGVDIGDEQLWRFLKSYRLLGYDLDVGSGVTLSLLHSHIGQFSIDNVDGLWALAAREVAVFNRNAGTLTLETISSEIRAAFAERRIETIPLQFLRRVEVKDAAVATDYLWSSEYADCLMAASLLGEWNDKVPADMAAAKRIVGGSEEDFTAWIESIRKVSLLAGTPLKQVDGKWKITNRRETWLGIGPRIFDAHLDLIRELSREVLGEHDPQFDLAPEDRFYATIRKKVFRYSPVLREGLATTLALLGTFPAAPTSASRGKAEATAILSVRDVLENADWLTWASLNDQLPLLAESAPSEFLSQVENALNQNPSPFVQVYAQEGGMPTGQNFITGLLWAMEILAWDANHLVRVVSILGDLAAIDPGGRWANRPANSLREILLPWHAQTMAPIAKRKVAVSTLLREQPETGWKLLLSLLPDMHSGASGTHKPTIREFVPKDREEPVAVTNGEYWEQVTGYAEMALEIAQKDFSKLDDIAQRIADLPEEIVTRLLEFLRTDAIKDLSEQDRWPIWKTLVDVAAQHEKYPDADWTMTGETIAKIKDATSLLAPKSPGLLFSRLFENNDSQLFESNDYQAERDKLEVKRDDAVRELLQHGGLAGILNFVEHVAAPLKVGFALGRLDLDTLDRELLPAHLIADKKPVNSMVEGFIRARLFRLGWTWVDEMIKPTWTREQTLALLIFLPVMPETWNRAASLLGSNGKDYWEKANVNGWGSEQGVSEAVSNLVRFGRPRSALLYLRSFAGLDHENLTPPTAIELLSALAKVDEPGVALNGDAVLRLIHWLQNDSASDSEELAKIEWVYLPFFNRSLGITPKILGREMASDPNFFCEVVATIFRSKEEKSKYEPTESDKMRARGAYHLLRNWNIIPGTSSDGSFDSSVFEKWLAVVRQKTTDSGHFDAAMGQFGEVLHNAPTDPDGLWIHRAVAEALNARDVDPLRAGFARGLINRRGAYWGTGGKAELEIAANYQKQAEAVELAGFHRFATTMRELAKRYEQDAERAAARERE